VILESGEIIKNSELTLPPAKTKSYAFCSDTSYKEDIVPIIKGVDLLYHEATFLSDREDLAKKTKHSTAKQAAQIALQSGVNQLVIGHYSSRYKNIELFKEEAETIFSKVTLAEAGKKISL
jgi:ribonuclease Z